MKTLLCIVCVCVGTAGAAAQSGVRWPSEGPPRPLAARDVKFPPYEVRTLPNGLQVVAVLHHEQPVVSMRMIVRAGSAGDPRDKLGLARLAASLLDQGTTTKSATELSDTIDFIGGEIGAGAATDLTFLNMIVMKDSFDTGLSMLSDMVRHPAFAQAEIDRQRQQMLSSLQVSLEDPEFIANAVFDRLVYGFHPYGLPDSGTPQTLSAIGRADLMAFHQQNFAPNNAILAIVGDVTAEEAFSGATRAFGEWERRDVPASTLTAPPDPTRRVIVVNKPDAVQTEVRVGHLGVRRTHQDYMALNVALRILGGEGANRLHQVLRTERGLTYGAQAEMNTLKEAGDFQAQTNTRSEATGEVLRLVVDEFWRLQRERVNERELGDAKAYMTGSFPLTIETPDAIATQVLNVLFYGLPITQLQTFRDRVNAVTAEDIQRVARAYLRPDRLSIVLVGNAAAFASQLKSIGFGTFETVNMEDLDLTSADFKRPARRASNPSNPLNLSNLSNSSNPSNLSILLERVIAAKGGAERLLGIRTITAVARTTTPGPFGTVGSRTTTYLEYPNKVRIETQQSDNELVQVYDGDHAWVKDSQGTRQASDHVVRDLVSSLKRDTVSLLIAARSGVVRSRLLPDVKDAAGVLHHALEVTGSDLDPMVLYIDPTTSLVKKQAYFSRPGRLLVEELFSDYRTVNGVQIAFAATVRQDGQLVLDRRVTDIRINASLEPSLFKRPVS